MKLSSSDLKSLEFLKCWKCATMAQAWVKFKWNKIYLNPHSWSLWFCNVFDGCFSYTFQIYNWKRWYFINGEIYLTIDVTSRGEKDSLGLTLSCCVRLSCLQTYNGKCCLTLGLEHRPESWHLLDGNMQTLPAGVSHSTRTDWADIRNSSIFIVSGKTAVC